MEKVDKLARMRHSFTAKFISEHIPNGSRILEIGGHRLTPYWLLAKKKYDIITVNLSDADYCLNIEKDSLNIIGERFRYVTMFEVIEHLENPLAALRNIHAIMENGGLFLGSTPNRFDQYLFLGAKIHEDHYYVFDKLTLKHLLHKCGFEPLQLKSRVLPVKLSRRIFISIDISELIPAGRVVFWVARAT